MKLRSRKEKKARRTTSVATEEVGEGWVGLLPELFNRVADEMLPSSLGRTVPLVCKAWNRMHKERLAVQKKWEVPQPVTPAGIQGFRIVAPSVEELHLTLGEHVDLQRVGMLPRILAIPAPNLRHLDLRCGKLNTSVMQYISRLTQLTKLRLGTRWLSDNIGDLGSLTVLRDLQKFHCTGIHLWWSKIWSAELWNSLAVLPRLSKVEVGVSNRGNWYLNEVPDDDLGPFLRQISRLTSIRSLKLSNENCQTFGSNTRNTVYASISPLTQLTALKLDLRLGPDEAPCLQLPLLKKLQLFFTQDCFPAKEHACMSSTTLTHLVLHGDDDKSLAADERTVDDLLPPSTPALANLRSLELWGYMLGELPPAVVSALPQLTFLSWRHSRMRAFTPALSAISLITSLVELDLSKNDEWVLADHNPAPLLALPHLTKLNLGLAQLVGRHIEIQ